MTEADRIVQATDAAAKAAEPVLAVIQTLSAAGRFEDSDRLLKVLRWWMDSWDRYLAGQETLSVMEDHFRALQVVFHEVTPRSSS